ncbi:MAG: GWxTD domain-containing protein [Bacteroidota bacterium]
MARYAARSAQHALVLGAALFLIGTAAAQDATGWAFAPPPVQHEAISLPVARGAAIDGTGLLFAVSVPHPRLTFAQRVDGRYEADVNVIATVQGSVATAPAGRLYLTTLADDYAATQDARQRHITLFGVSWGAGVFPHYFLTIQFARGSDSRDVQGTLGQVPDYEQPTVGRPIVIERPTAQERSALSFQLAAEGGTVPFDRPAALLVPLHRSGPATTVRFTLKDAEGQTLRSDTQPVTTLPPTYGLDLGTLAATPGQIAFAPAPADSPLRLGVFDVSALEEGTYTVEIALPDTGLDVVTETLEVVWPTKPRSMQDDRVAFDALRAIAVEDEVRQIERGRGGRKWERLANFWTERDPSPGTPFNELMAEFYARVDEAAVRFRTTPNGRLDGYTTEQGRLWLRHGAPADIDRTLPPGGGPREVWTYADGRRYTFEATVPGEPLRRVN